MHRWEITKDHTAEPGDKPGTNSNAVGINYNDHDGGHLTNSNKTAFRMYDDDGNLYYEGFLYGDFDGFEPLDDFGMPNAGCTSIYLKENGEWSQL